MMVYKIFKKLLGDFLSGIHSVIQMEIFRNSFYQKLKYLLYWVAIEKNPVPGNHESYAKVSLFKSVSWNEGEGRIRN